MYRAAIGPWVRNRLLKVSGIFKVPAAGLDIFVLRDFLDGRECAGLMKRIDADRQPSGVLGEVPDREFRTSETCNLDPFDRSCSRSRTSSLH